MLFYSPRHAREAAEGRIGFFICLLAVFAADQISKTMVVSGMVLYQSEPLIRDFFHITYILNSGASFGMLQNRIAFLTLITCFEVAAILWITFAQKGVSKPVRLILGFITGGALGNLADRIRHGAVVDFIDFRGIWRYIFNVADIAVVCGGLTLLFLVILGDLHRSGRERKH